VTDPSIRPYLIRALHQWAMDAGFTPQLAVDATQPGVQVPAGYVRDGQIVLNVHPQSVHQLEIGNDTISFFARFSGKSEPVVVPVRAVLAVYARETGQGMMFGLEDDVADAAEAPTRALGEGGDEPDKPGKGRPKLKVVK